jgi:hypothetical protein
MEGDRIMTDQRRTPTPAPTPTETERRNQASAGSHGGVEVLDADRPQGAGSPAITHQTTTDPYRDAPAAADPRPLGQPGVAPQQSTLEASRGRNAWGAALATLAVIVLLIWLITWFF